MKRLGLFAMASATMMLMMVFAVSCTKPDVEHEYVDLGLPSGTLWATCNIGATTPEGYGDYFAWGETKAKSVYNWEKYKYAKGYFDEYPLLTKYCTDDYYGNYGFEDNLTLLQPGDDAATANWGRDWRTPTLEDWVELRENTTRIWTTQNGVDGKLFTGPNGNTLFLPAARLQKEDTNFNYSFGSYWSNTLKEWSPNCAIIFTFEERESDYEISSYYRCYGLSVRAVRCAK